MLIPFSVVPVWSVSPLVPSVSFLVQIHRGPLAGLFFYFAICERPLSKELVPVAALLTTVMERISYEAKNSK